MTITMTATDVRLAGAEQLLDSAITVHGGIHLQLVAALSLLRLGDHDAARRDVEIALSMSERWAVMLATSAVSG